MKTLLITLLGLLVVLAIAVPLGIHWMRGHIGHLDAYFDGRIISPSAPPGSGEPGDLKVLAWNIHYGVGPRDDLHDRRSEAEVRGFLDAIAAVAEA